MFLHFLRFITSIEQHILLITQSQYYQKKALYVEAIAPIRCVITTNLAVIEYYRGNIHYYISLIKKNSNSVNSWASQTIP